MFIIMQRIDRLQCHPPPNFPPNTDRRPSRLFSLACNGRVRGRIGHQHPQFARHRTAQRRRVVYRCHLDCGQHMVCPTQTSTRLCTYPWTIFFTRQRAPKLSFLDYHDSFHSATPACTCHILCVSLAQWRLARKGDTDTWWWTPRFIR